MTAFSIEGQPLFNPMTDLDEITVYHGIVNGHLSARQLGLVRKPDSFIDDGIERILIPHYRVVSLEPDGGYTEAAWVKLRTMDELTPSGVDFLDALKAEGITKKSRDKVRVASALSRVARTLVLDESLQPFFHLWGMGASLFPEHTLAKSKLVAANRPLTADEIVLSGDNSNDDLAHALEEVAPEVGADNYRETYKLMAPHYEVGIFSYPTAEGITEVDIDTLPTIIRGIFKYAELKNQPAKKQVAERRRIVARSTGHIAAKLLSKGMNPIRSLLVKL